MSKSIERNQLKILETRMSEERRFIQVLLGPRQVGKTTIIKQLIKKLTIPYLYVTADETQENNVNWIEQQWQSLRLRMNANDWKEAILIIDEIQRITEWSTMVKKLWDEDTMNDTPIKVILLGSARIVLQKGLNESLAGRFEEIRVPRWSFSEMRDAFGFSVEQYAWFGSYPGSATLINNEKRWKDYVRNSLVESVISKDVFMMNTIQKPALFRNLFEIACLNTGKILSYTKILGQLVDAGNTTTLSHYQELLESAGLVSGIEKFSPNLVRQRSSSPKWQVHNMALYSSISRKLFNEIYVNAAEWGRVVESAVGAHLMCSYQLGEIDLFYWREVNDEVDFVIQKGKNILAIEVKSGGKRSNRGISVFKKKFPDAKIILVGDSGIPWQEFLMTNPAEML